jgi:4-hydroxy-2-oxoheptanedioate aldolase
MVAVQIEREEAVDNVEEIVSVEGVDATWIGPADLSLSMGLKVKDTRSHPRVLAAMEKVVEACDGAGVAPGIAAGGEAEYINELIERGFRFILVQGDLGLLNLGCGEYLKKIRSHPD